MAGDVLREDMSWGPVTMEVTVEPAKVNLKSDTILTLAVSAPEQVDVSLPDLDDRVEGFVVSGTFEEEPVAERDTWTRVRHVRLTPTLSDTYRIRPFAVSTVDRRNRPEQTSWFPTRPIVLQKAKLVKGGPGKDIEAVWDPVWIYPPFKTVALGFGAILAAVLLVILGWRLARRIRRHVEWMRLSPRERALKELSVLMNRHLVEKDMVKDFYLELTMIVRRYIERQHAVRAPEQTTEEFLAAAVRHPRFTRPVLDRLKAFLEAADLVKFAAHHPEHAMIEQAISMAKAYIETDAPADVNDEKTTMGQT